MITPLDAQDPGSVSDRPTTATFTGRMVAIVPVRSLFGGKTRLAEVLSPEERADVVRSMLTQVVQACVASGVLGAVVVVSSDPEVLRFAASLDPLVYPLAQDSDQPGLIPAVEQARAWAEGQGASGILIISGDLPLLRSTEVRDLVRRDAPLVIAPDRHGHGTNALLLRLGGGSPAPAGPSGKRVPVVRAFAFHFGPESFALHQAEAERLGLDAAVALMPGTSLDLDTPGDLQELEQRVNGLMSA